jgi:choline dehydrogenase-like flavoprotein
VTPDFDVIIVGSGPAGVSAAFPLVEAGLRILMVDGGKRPDVQPPEMDFLSARTNDAEQWKWMVGEDFHALKMRDAVSPKLRVPSHAFAFDGFGRGNKIEGTDFITVGSLATGGLSNSWGCGVARYSATEIATFPFTASELEPSYATVCQRMGISGKMDDDMSDYFGLDEFSQPPIPMDMLHTRLSQRYTKRRRKLNSQGFRLGRSRVAALSEDISDRQACNLSGNCLWGCRRRSLYSAADDLPKLREHENFSELSGFVVDGLTRYAGCWRVEGQSTSENERKTISAKRIVLAAGTLATTRMVLKTLNYEHSVPVLSCPTAAFLLWIPRLLGTQRLPGFGLGQLSYALALHNNITAFGSTFATTGIPLSEFARHIPLRRRYGLDLLRGLLSSCVVGNLFLPGHLTIAGARLREDGSLIISGKYDDVVSPLMDEASRSLRKSYWCLGAMLLPGSFTIGRPGGDIHYAGTLPMRRSPVVGETTQLGEVVGLEEVYIVDGACLPILSEKSHTLTIMANADRIGRQLITRILGGH